jgi:hypothetical protein
MKAHCRAEVPRDAFLTSSIDQRNRSELVGDEKSLLFLHGIEPQTSVLEPGGYIPCLQEPVTRRAPRIFHWGGGADSEAVCNLYLILTTVL